MPITPLHFGLNGTISSISPQRVDILSSILANIIIDIQPMLVIFLKAPIKLHGISHTLIFTLIVCAIFFLFYGAIIKKVFHIKKPLSAFIIGGILGGILHIILDSFYHQDIRPFYPFSNYNLPNFNITAEINLLGLIGYIIFCIILFIKLFKKSYGKNQQRSS